MQIDRSAAPGEARLWVNCFDHLLPDSLQGQRPEFGHRGMAVKLLERTQGGTKAMYLSRGCAIRMPVML
jgi:hypothetical protein